MAKICPECGYELNGNEDTCPECGRNLNFKKDAPEKVSSSKGSAGFLSMLIPIAIVAIVIIGAVMILPGLFNSDDSITITVSETGGWISSYDNNTTISYYYFVNGYITGIPSNAGDYFIRTIYYDANNSEVGRTTENLENIHNMLSESDIHQISGYFPNHEVSIDHVKIQIIRNNEIVKEFDEKFDTDNIEYFY